MGDREIRRSRMLRRDAALWCPLSCRRILVCYEDGVSFRSAKLDGSCALSFVETSMPIKYMVGPITGYPQLSIKGSYQEQLAVSVGLAMARNKVHLAAMMPRLGYVAVRTPPMPYRLLKLAEDHA